MQVEKTDIYTNTFSELGFNNSYIQKNDKQIAIIFGVLCLFMAITGGNPILIGTVVVLYIYILLKAGFERGVCLYIFISLWSNFTTLPVFSGISIISLFLAIYTLFLLLKNDNTILFEDFILLTIVLLEGIYSLMVSNATEGLMLTADTIVVCYIVRKMKQSDVFRKKFWELFFFCVFVSTMFSILWGVISFMSGNNDSTLYLYGQRFPRFRSTVGIDRSCMVYCTSLIYCLCYEKRKWIKVFSEIAIVVALLFSLSITAIICLGVVIVTYMIHEYRRSHNNKRLWIILLLFIGLGYILYLYFFGSHINVINTIVERVRLIFYRINTGNSAAATSGRTDLWEGYISGFYNQNILNKLFGSGYTSVREKLSLANYAHNTYIDILLYFGLIPTILILYRLIMSLYRQRKNEEFIQVLMLKEAYIITALSVSMLTNEYFWMVFIL